MGKRNKKAQRLRKARRAFLRTLSYIALWKQATVFSRVADSVIWKPSNFHFEMDGHYDEKGNPVFTGISIVPK